MKNVRASLQQDSDDEEERYLQRKQQSKSETALLVAVQEGDVREVMTYLEKGVNPNINRRNHEPPLVEAFLSGNIDIAAALLLHSADPLQFSLSGAALTELVSDPAPKILLDFFMGADVDEESKGCLLSSLDKFMRWRVARKIAENEELQLNRRPETNKRQVAVSSNPARRPGRNDEKLRELQQMAESKARSLVVPQAVAQPSTSMPQEVASSLGLQRAEAPIQASAAVPQHAITKGTTSKIDSHGTTARSEAPLQVSKAAPQHAIAKETTSKIDSYGITVRSEAKKTSFGSQVAEPVSDQPLIAAARCGDLDTVKRLLYAKADANVQDEIGETPLFEAAACGDMNMIAALLLGKADPSQQSLAGMKPRDLADKSSSTLSLLLDLPVWLGQPCRDEDAEKVAREIDDKDTRDGLCRKMWHMQAHAQLVRQIHALPMTLGSA